MLKEPKAAGRLGTEYNVGKFVMISTDKAVNQVTWWEQ
jgi:FlaA1/EpsC-like NDP-sugar epimerase